MGHFSPTGSGPWNSDEHFPIKSGTETRNRSSVFNDLRWRLTRLAQTAKARPVPIWRGRLVRASLSIPDILSRFCQTARWPLHFQARPAPSPLRTHFSFFHTTHRLIRARQSVPSHPQLGPLSTPSIPRPHLGVCLSQQCPIMAHNHTSAFPSFRPGTLSWLAFTPAGPIV